MGRVYTKEEFLELFDENLVEDLHASYEFNYKGWRFLINSPMEMDDGVIVNTVQNMGHGPYECYFTGKPGDPHWLLYNFMLDGKPLIERVEECILEGW